MSLFSLSLWVGQFVWHDCMPFLHISPSFGSRSSIFQAFLSFQTASFQFLRGRPLEVQQYIRKKNQKLLQRTRIFCLWKFYVYLGAVTLRTSLTQASNIEGSSVVWDIVTPTFAQNKLIASGGIPLRLNAVNVNKRGSSQSSTSLWSINLPIFLFETTV